MYTNADEFMTTKDCAAYLGASQRTVWRLVHSRRMSYHKIGRLTRLLKRDVDTYIERQRVAAKY